MERASPLPEPLATVEVRLGDGAVSVVRRHGNPYGPRLVLSHGGGVAADTYWPYWSLLLDGFDIAVYDLRSHGWNPPSELRIHNLPTLVDDNRRILDAVGAAFGAKPTVGVFHSLTTVVALMHEQQWPTFAALVLFDAPIYPPGADLGDMEAVNQRHAERARGRRRWYESSRELAAALARSPFFARVSPEVCALFAETTLRPVAGGGYELRCPPEYEAQLAQWYFGFSMQAPEALETIDIPIKVVGGDPSVPSTFLPSMDLSTLTSVDYDFIPDATHLLQLEVPQDCVDMTIQFLRRHGLCP